MDAQEIILMNDIFENSKSMRHIEPTQTDNLQRQQTNAKNAHHLPSFILSDDKPKNGATCVIRTRDLSLTKRML